MCNLVHILTIARKVVFSQKPVIDKYKHRVLDGDGSDTTSQFSQEFLNGDGYLSDQVSEGTSNYSSQSNMSKSRTSQSQYSRIDDEDSFTSELTQSKNLFYYDFT